MESSKKRNSWESIGRHRMPKVDEAGNKTVVELLKKCKPLSVNMIRLPTPVVNTCTTISTAEVKTKNRFRRKRNTWKHGCDERKRQRIRVHLRKIRLLQMGQIPEEKNKNVEETKGTEAKHISDGFLTSSNEQNEDSPETTNAFNENKELNIDRTESQVEGRKLTSSEHEASSFTESLKVLPIAAVGTVEPPKNNVAVVEKLADKIPDQLSEPIDNSLSRKISLRHAVTHKNDENRTIIRNTRKRKRSLQTIDDEVYKTHELLQGAKKYKSIDGSSEEKKLPEEKNIGKLLNDVVSVAKQNKGAKSKTRNRKSVRRQNNSVNEVRVSLTKLEDLLDPLVLQWREKLGLELLNDAEATTCVISPIEKRIQEKSQPIRIEESSKKASPVKDPCNVPMIHNPGLEVDTNVNVASLKTVFTVSEANNFRLLDEAVGSSDHLAELQERSTIENEENDEEIMEFLRSPRKVRPSIDSSSSASISDYRETAKTPMLRRSARIHGVSPTIDSDSDSEEISTTRVLRSHAKTPSIDPERTRPDTRMSRMLRQANSSAIDTLYSESALQQNKSPKTKTPSYRYSVTRTSTDSSMTETEVERSYITRSKSRQLVINDTSSESTYNPGEALTDFIDEQTSIPIHNRNRVEKTINTHGTEIEHEAANNEMEKIDNIADRQYAQDDATQVEAITEVQCNSSVVDNLSNSTDSASANCNDSLIARKKLSALNAMVVLTRLENLDDISVDGPEFKTAEDSPWLTNFSLAATDDRTSRVSRVDSNSNDNLTPLDPLEINEDHESSHCEDNSPIGLFSQRLCNLNDVEAVKSSSRKSSRVIQMLNDDTDTVESDVELSLVWEDGERSPGNFLDQSQTSGMGESVNTNCTPTEGIVIDTNGNSPRQLHIHDDLNEHCKQIGSSVKNNVGLRRADKSPEKRKSGEKLTTKKADIDNYTDKDKRMETISSKTKQKKSTAQTKLPKKSRTKITASVEEPICKVCSINFVTTQALSEHIYKHSPEELQDAYKKIKAMMPSDSQAARAVPKKPEKSVAKSQEAGSSTIVNVDEGKTLQTISSVSMPRAIQSNARSVVPILAQICACHQDYDESVDKSDLQIEMVLVCQQCQVLFRRRECFEVHYRTSQQCANDRMLGRLPILFCANCQLTLESWKTMRHHLEVHAGENPEGTVRFVCNICRVVFVGFGALFYNHWFSHSKDRMFVASRYTFPKNSVQPKDGLAKLPIGASINEMYIWVAEHVCGKCKKPFSTRPDLDSHQKIDPYCSTIASVQTSNEPVVNNESEWYCDVCNLVFVDRDKLNEHGVNCHARRFTCVSTSPRQQTFMCTKCCAMRKRIKDIEDHWMTDPKHNTETINVDNSELAVITSSGNQNRVVEKLISRNVDRVVSSATLHTPTVPSKNAIEKDGTRRSTSVKRKTENKNVRNENDTVFQASVVNSQNKSFSYTDNQESSIGTARSVEVERRNASTVLDNVMNRDTATNCDETLSARKSSEKNRTRIRVLEDPSVNIVLSDSSSTQLSASLIIDESRDRISNDTGDDSITESYQILMMDHNPKSTSGPIKMVFGRKSTGNTAENVKESRTDESLDKPNSDTVTETLTFSKSSVAGKNNGKSLPNECRKTTSATDTSEFVTDKMTVKENSYWSNISKNNETDLSLSSLLKNQSEVPEIIEIIEEIELANLTSQVSKNAYSLINSKVSSTKPMNKEKGNVRSKKSTATKLQHNVVSPKNLTATRKKPWHENSSSSGMNSSMSMNDSGKSDHSEGHLQTRQALSFEEARYADQILSKNSIVDTATSKKQGFLRVKNLSELQAVKKYACQICEANFESMTCLDEHNRQHLKSSGDKFAKNRKGMSAALLLPDPSELPKTSVNIAPKSLRQIITRLPTQSYIPQRIMSLATSGVDNTNAGNTWIRIENRNTTVADSQSNASNTSNASGELLSNYNVNADSGKSVITSTASLAQSRQNFSNQSQTPNTPVGYISVQDINRPISEVRNTGQIGYHILPAMVAPSSQSTKQPIAAASQQNFSSNNLPISGLTVVSSLNQQQVNVNKYVCTICTTFRCDTIGAFNEHLTKHLVGFNNPNATQNATAAAVPTVIVPPASSFRTGNETVSDTIAETKSNNDRFVVNNWIVHPSISWSNSTFSQQPAPPSSALPMTTQTLLTTAVQNSNGNSTNSTKSATVWLPPNSNTNNTNALKQPTGWSSSTFNTGEIIGGHIVYQCKICKSAMYSDHEHFRKHVLLVHGIENFLKSSIENIVQMNYYCRRCPNGAEAFDSLTKLMMHQNTDHENICPTCNRSFGSYIYLTDHIAHCR